MKDVDKFKNVFCYGGTCCGGAVPGRCWLSGTVPDNGWCLPSAALRWVGLQALAAAHTA